MMLSILLGMIGWQQILIIAIIILVLFGGKKIPEMMRGVGKGMKEFKDATKADVETEEDDKKSEGNIK